MVVWDKSHNWVVTIIDLDLWRLVITFKGIVPSTQELMTIRKIFPQFQDAKPATLKASIAETGKLEIGDIEGRKAKDIVPALTSAGLEVIVEPEDYLGYLLYDRTDNLCWHIEDNVELKRVAQEMIAAGITIEHIQA